MRLQELFFLTSDLSYEIGFTDKDQSDVVSSMITEQYWEDMHDQNTKGHKCDLQYCSIYGSESISDVLGETSEWEHGILLEDKRIIWFSYWRHKLSYLELYWWLSIITIQIIVISPFGLKNSLPHKILFLLLIMMQVLWWYWFCSL